MLCRLSRRLGRFAIERPMKVLDYLKRNLQQKEKHKLSKSRVLICGEKVY